MAKPQPAYEGDGPYSFVSYAHADEDEVFSEIAWLQDQGVNLWYDTGIHPGSEWSDSVAAAIKRAESLLFFITPRSVASEHCRQELNFALNEGIRVQSISLVPTDLPDGLRLRLDNRQVIHKYRFEPGDYQRALLKGARGESLAAGRDEISREDASRNATRTVLHGEIIGAVEVAERSGRENYELYRQQHQQAMTGLIEDAGGEEVSALGDAVVVTFNGVGEALSCAVAMQQAHARLGRRGITTGFCIGISTGDVTLEGGACFGRPVVEASGLCIAAASGQIIVSDVVRLLDRSGIHTYQEFGAVRIRNLSEPVAASEVVCDLEPNDVLRDGSPFVGRGGQLARLREALARTQRGDGQFVMITGEPGIGKTRLLEEFGKEAQRVQVTVARGTCFERDWAPPYGPFAQAIEKLVEQASGESLAADLGPGAATLSRVVPGIADHLDGLEEPVALSASEEQYRILDAAAQFFAAMSARTPLLLILDDLHWADTGTVAMLRHIAGVTSGRSILVVGAYRDVDLDRHHPLAEALSQLRREVEYERIDVKGLSSAEIAELLKLIAHDDAPAEFVDALTNETEGNPFFIREVLLHLVEEETLVRKDGRWTSEIAVAEMGIPEGVRQVIGQRLSRLSEAANQLLAAASAFNGPFSFGATAAAAGLDEMGALDAVDEALGAQLIRPSDGADVYDFTHALIRTTLYTEMNPSRQVRLHRRLAEEMRESLGERAMDAAAEIANQFYRSAVLPGAEAGVEFALVAADRSAAGYAWGQSVSHLRVALELMTDDDVRRAEILGRLGRALPLVSEPGGSIATIREAAKAIAATQGDVAAADFLAEASEIVMACGSHTESFEICREGMQYIGERRDWTWVNLMQGELIYRDIADANYPGIPTVRSEHEELFSTISLLRDLVSDVAPDVRWGWPDPEGREGILRRGSLMMRAFAGGDLRGSVDQLETIALQAENEGRLDQAASTWAGAVRLRLALGEFDQANTHRQRGIALSRRLPGIGNSVAQLAGANRMIRAMFTNEGWERLLEFFSLADDLALPQFAIMRATTRSFLALTAAACGERELAAKALAELRPALDRGAPWIIDYAEIAFNAATVIWWTGEVPMLSCVEENLREKVIVADYRNPKGDSRLSLAYLCALDGRLEEAREWFDRARFELDAQGARPLRAITDFDEAWALVRAEGRAVTSPGFPESVRTEVRDLLARAVSEFEAIGMPGWTRAAAALNAGREIFPAK